jgi:glutathione synthase/RimK-type ligase-like ATP-grasp enzyme
MRLTVVANPRNRRLALFNAAVRAAGLAEPAVVPWHQVAAGGPVPIRPGSLVRIESPGEDGEVDRLLRGATEPAAHGEIIGTAAWYRGFAHALGRIASGAGGAVLVSDPAEILTLFDKRRCHAVLSAAGVPVPETLPLRGGYAELRDAMRAAGWPAVFVKPAHGSSASGVLALRAGAGRVRATTSVELVRPRLFNSLRLRTYADERDIASIVDTLAVDGLHVERWFAKAGLSGQTVDLRVVVIAGRASHVVVRASDGPMTNLHLGNRRGDLSDLRAAAGPVAYAAALDTCVRVGALFPGSLQVGVDLMFSPNWRRHAVAEVNAFGDLLPGLEVEGRDTYATQVAALCSGWRPGAAMAVAA